MKKLLILGGLNDFSHIVNAAKERGIYTIVTDYITDAPAKKIADQSYNISILDRHGLDWIMEKEKPDGVVTGFADLMIEPLAYLTDKYNLPSPILPSQVKDVTDKRIMKQKLEKAGLKISAYAVLSESEDIEKYQHLQYPIVLKPVDSYGSKGVFFVENQDELAKQFLPASEFSSDGSVLAEEYYPSDEVCVLCWVLKGKCHVIYIGDKELRKNSNQRIGKPKRLIYPSRHSYQYEEEFFVIAQKVTEAFDLKNGPLYIQAFVGTQGIYINEVMARLPGGNDFRFVKGLTGLDVVGTMVDYSVGIPVDEKVLIEHSAHFSETRGIIQLYAEGNRCVAEFIGVDEVQNMIDVTDCEFYVSKGDMTVNTGDLRQTIGRIFFRAANYYQADKITQEILSILDIRDKDGNSILAN